MCVCPTFLTGMMPAYRSHMAWNRSSVARWLCVTTGMRIFSRSVRRHDIDVLDDAEVGAVNRQRAGEIVADDHVSGQVAPLVQRSAHLAFLLLRPRALRAQRQLVVAFHLVPADLVNPAHGALGFEIVQLLPQPCLLCVDWQRCDPG